MAELFRRAAAGEGPYWLRADLLACEVWDNEGFRAGFTMDAYRRDSLLRGLDEIGHTLQSEPAIAAFERRRVARQVRLAQ